MMNAVGNFAAGIAGMLHTVVIFTAVIFVIILAHEFGHFITAVLCGVRVKEFALGFGSIIKGYRRKNTEYNLRMIPIGGFVELAGTDPRMSEEEGDIPEQEKFYNKTVLQRFLILFAGPFFNFILAMAVFFFGFLFYGVPQPRFSAEPVIGALISGKPAEKSGLSTGDKIVSINGTEVKTWEKMAEIISKSAYKPLSVTYIRGDSQNQVLITPEPYQAPPEKFSQKIRKLFKSPQKDEIPTEGIIGIFRGIEPVVGEIIPGKPAQSSGIISGDRILKIDGESIYCWQKAVAVINKSVDRSLTIDILRADKILTVTATPEFSPELDAGVIGVNFDHEYVKAAGILEVCILSWDYTVRTTGFMISGLRKLFSGRVSMKSVSGPIGIAGVVKEKAGKGMADLLSIIALLSLNIGLLNLLPFPALDGGRILFIVIEIISRRRVSVKLEETIHMAGLYALLFLLLVVSLRDVKNLEIIKKLNLF